MLLDGVASIALSSSDWTAVGSIGTALAALVALGSLLVARRKSRDEEAAQFRQRVQTFVVGVQPLLELLRDGSPLISAAWQAARSLRTQAGEEPTADSLRSLIGDSPAALTASVEGWGSSRPAAELRKAFAELKASGRELPGHMSLFWPVVVLLQNMVDDAYSNRLFIRLLTDTPAEHFISEHRDDDLDGLTRSIATHLHGNSAMYFTVRYEAALDAIQAFVEIAGEGFADLDTAALVQAGRAKTPITITTSKTYTGELRERVTRLSDLLPRETVRRLETEIDVIEGAISKDSALEHLSVQQ
jgi:hypothetical protein